MNMSIRIALLVVTLFITAACTPPYLRNDKTRSEVSGDTYGEYKAVPKQTETPPTSARQKLEEPKSAQITPPEEKRPKTQVIEPTKTTEKSESKPPKPSPVAKSKPARQTPSKPKVPVEQKRTPTSTATADKPSVTQVAKRDAPVITPQATVEPAAQPASATATPEVSAEPESPENTPETALLTQPTSPADAAPPATPSVKSRPLNMADLPLSFGADWSLDRRPDPVDHKTRCLLASRALNIPDGYDRTDVQLLLTAKTLYVKADSNIDLGYPETGLRLDDGALQPFEGLAEKTTAEIGDDVAGLYARMKGSRTMQVRLGFWPTWPVTKTQEADFPLDGFGAALDALRLCEKM